MNKRIYIIIVFSILMVPIFAFAQSKPYKPVSETEATFFNSSNQYIFPDDVRKNIEKFEKI